MRMNKVTDAAFRPYGKIVKDFDTRDLLSAMERTPAPDHVIYVASVPELEALPVAEDFARVFYGGMPIQVGYCNGVNAKLNALEYHRDSELNLACTDMVLMVGREQDIDPEALTYPTERVEAFLVPKGTLVELYATTLHYAPASASGPFRCVVVLPRGTNSPLSRAAGASGEDRLITAVNKWLIAHEESGLGAEGARVGLVGENLRVG